MLDWIKKEWAESKERIEHNHRGCELAAFARNVVENWGDLTRTSGIYSGSEEIFQDEVLTIKYECVMPFTMMTNPEWEVTVTLSSGEVVLKAWRDGFWNNKNKFKLISFVDGLWTEYLESLHDML